MISYLDFNFLVHGLFNTIVLAFFSIIGSMFLGTILGALRYSKAPILSWIAVAFIEITRSIPLILFIIFIHFTISPIVYQNFTASLGAFSLEFQSAIIALVLFTSAYVAEIIRSGLNSIESAQINSAKSLGLNKLQMLKYIILPIAISRMVPALVTQFISLAKDTSLISIIGGVIELTRSGEIIYERTHQEFQVLLVVAFLYFIVCFGLSCLSKKLEDKKVLFSSFGRFLSID